jgi:thiol-disulfide isomerase/thioredoxin
MIKKILSFIVILFLSSLAVGQQTTSYRVVLQREDGNQIVFIMNTGTVNGRPQWVIRNAGERITVDSIVQKGDSLLVEMPLFDSRMRLRVSQDKSMTGTWTRAITSGNAVMPLTATPGVTDRFPPLKGKALKNISGRYAVIFTKPDGSGKRKSVAEFRQKDNIVTGTFLNPSGDYRYLEGIVTGDSLMLSCFDGAHAYYFGAAINKDGSLRQGVFYSLVKATEEWTALKDPSAKLDESNAMVYLRDGEERLNFSFPDLDSNQVSINDPRFKDKVVIIQIMGSWCPNCMDETAFLSDYYKKNRERGVEVVGLAYEYSTDFHRSEKTLRKFQQRYKVDYPILVTGVTTIDTLKTEKTLPQLTPIKGFPTTIFIGKDGRVKKIEPGFMGPGTGKHHDIYKKEFNTTIDELLKEKSQ